MGKSHGHSSGNDSKSGRSDTYVSWLAMKQRCFNTGNAQYYNYGGRGVRICDSWLDYENFLRDMGERPPNKSLDRFPNINGDYEPKNCRWATPLQQVLNRRKKYGPSKSQFKGVSPYFHKWRATIRDNGKPRHIGMFFTEEEAARAYDRQAKELYGEDVLLNFPN